VTQPHFFAYLEIEHTSLNFALKKTYDLMQSSSFVMLYLRMQTSNQLKIDLLKIVDK
jgi:hypothetical protein